MNRRRFLRGLLGGGAVTVGLPLLDLFLDEHGEALADGTALPLVVGTWFWGCGVNPQRWVPAEEGADWALTPAEREVALMLQLPLLQ